MNARSHDTVALDGRTAAVGAVTNALTGRGFASAALRGLRSSGRVGGREASLATEIAQGTLRHLVTIEHIVSAVAQFHPRRTPAALRAVLYTTTYQLVWMGRIPPFAAIDRGVELARRLVGGRAPGMANAVLRRVADAATERAIAWQRLDPRMVRADWARGTAFNVPVLPEPAGDDGLPAHLAAATGERPERWRTLCERYGAARAEAVAWASQATPVTVVQRNPQRATPAAFETFVQMAAGDDYEIVGDTAYLTPAATIVDVPGFAEGLAYVQDGTAQRAAAAVAAQPGERILDLCAAPGGKTVALALAMQDRGAVIACDTVSERLGRVDANVWRMGLTCVHTRLLEKSESPLALGTQTLDAALVDVPCTNTGVIARRPEARLGLTLKKLKALDTVQANLLAQAAALVRPGGRVVYSTCSLEPGENGEQVAAFLQAHSEWRLACQETTLPAWGPRWSDWRDGGYFARLERRA